MLKASFAELIGKQRLLAIRVGDRVTTKHFFRAVLGPAGPRSHRARIVPSGTTLVVLGNPFVREGGKEEEIMVAFPYDDPNVDRFAMPLDMLEKPQ